MMCAVMLAMEALEIRAEYDDTYPRRIRPLNDCAIAFEALSTDMAKPDGWMPIESAPKDGQCLLWVETDDGGEVMKLYRDSEGNWLYEGEPIYSTSFYIEPTHWMPLPKPPADQPKA